MSNITSNDVYWYMIRIEFAQVFQRILKLRRREDVLILIFKICRQARINHWWSSWISHERKIELQKHFWKTWQDLERHDVHAIISKLHDDVIVTSLVSILSLSLLTLLTKWTGTSPVQNQLFSQLNLSSFQAAVEKSEIWLTAIIACCKQLVAILYADF